MSLRAQAQDILLNHDFHTCLQHESLALHENYAAQWKILHNGLMVYKSPKKKQKTKKTKNKKQNKNKRC